MISIVKWLKLIKDLDRSKNWPIFFWGIFLIASIISLWALFNPTPIFTHDNNYEIWLGAFDSLIKTGQLFPSWVKSFWLEHGSPLFIFYPPLFFYLAEIPRLLGASLVIAVKVIVGLSFLFSFFTMYLLGKEFWGKWGGLFAGLLYMTAPYHFALIYTRGAYAENLAYAIFPLIFWFIYKIFKESKNWWYVIGLVLSAASLILTNLPSVMIFFVLAVLLIIGLIWYEKKFPIIQLGLGALGGLLLSAFYWLPAFLNKGFIQFEYFITGQFHFSKYFTNLVNYLPFRPWMNIEFYQWGIIAWIIIVVVVFYLIRSNWQKRQEAKLKVGRRVAWLLLIMLILITLLMTPFSYPLWENVPIIQYIQFPYRFLSVIFILISLLGAYVIYKINNSWRIALLVLVLIQAVIFAYPVTRLRHELYRNDAAYTVYGDFKAQLITIPDKDKDKEGIPKILLAHTTEVGYLPKDIDKEIVRTEFIRPIFETLLSMSLEESAYYTLPDSDKIITFGDVSGVQDELQLITFNYYYDKPSRVYYRQFGFPGWQVLVDNKQTEWESSTGQISFVVPAGEHQVKIEYTNPPGAVTGRIISALGLIVVLYFISRLPILSSLRRRRSPGRVPHPRAGAAAGRQKKTEK